MAAAAGRAGAPVQGIQAPGGLPGGVPPHPTPAQAAALAAPPIQQAGQPGNPPNINPQGGPPPAVSNAANLQSTITIHRVGVQTLLRPTMSYKSEEAKQKKGQETGYDYDKMHQEDQDRFKAANIVYDFIRGQTMSPEDEEHVMKFFGKHPDRGADILCEVCQDQQQVQSFLAVIRDKMSDTFAGRWSRTDGLVKMLRLKGEFTWQVKVEKIISKIETAMVVTDERVKKSKKVKEVEKAEKDRIAAGLPGTSPHPKLLNPNDRSQNVMDNIDLNTESLSHDEIMLIRGHPERGKLAAELYQNNEPAFLKMIYFLRRGNDRAGLNLIKSSMKTHLSEEVFNSLSKIIDKISLEPAYEGNPPKPLGQEKIDHLITQLKGMDEGAALNKIRTLSVSDLKSLQREYTPGQLRQFQELSQNKPEIYQALVHSLEKPVQKQIRDHVALFNLQNNINLSSQLGPLLAALPPAPIPAPPPGAAAVAAPVAPIAAPTPQSIMAKIQANIYKPTVKDLSFAELNLTKKVILENSSRLVRELRANPADQPKLQELHSLQSAVQEIERQEEILFRQELANPSTSPQVQHNLREAQNLIGSQIPIEQRFALLSFLVEEDKPNPAPPATTISQILSDARKTKAQNLEKLRRGELPDAPLPYDWQALIAQNRIPENEHRTGPLNDFFNILLPAKIGIGITPPPIQIPAAAPATPTISIHSPESPEASMLDNGFNYNVKDNMFVKSTLVLDPASSTTITWQGQFYHKGIKTPDGRALIKESDPISVSMSSLNLDDKGLDKNDTFKLICSLCNLDNPPDPTPVGSFDEIPTVYKDFLVSPNIYLSPGALQLEKQEALHRYNGELRDTFQKVKELSTNLKSQINSAYALSVIEPPESAIFTPYLVPLQVAFATGVPAVPPALAAAPAQPTIIKVPDSDNRSHLFSLALGLKALAQTNPDIKIKLTKSRWALVPDDIANPSVPSNAFKGDGSNDDLLLLDSAAQDLKKIEHDWLILHRTDPSVRNKLLDTINQTQIGSKKVTNDEIETTKNRIAELERNINTIKCGNTQLYRFNQLETSINLEKENIDRLKDELEQQDVQINNLRTQIQSVDGENDLAEQIFSIGEAIEKNRTELSKSQNLLISYNSEKETILERKLNQKEIIKIQLLEDEISPLKVDLKNKIDNARIDEYLLKHETLNSPEAQIFALSNHFDIQINLIPNDDLEAVKTFNKKNDGASIILANTGGTHFDLVPPARVAAAKAAAASAKLAQENSAIAAESANDIVLAPSLTANVRTTQLASIVANANAAAEKAKAFAVKAEKAAIDSARNVENILIDKLLKTSTKIVNLENELLKVNLSSEEAAMLRATTIRTQLTALRAELKELKTEADKTLIYSALISSLQTHPKVVPELENTSEERLISIIFANLQNEEGDPNEAIVKILSNHFFIPIELNLIDGTKKTFNEDSPDSPLKITELTEKKFLATIQGTTVPISPTLPTNNSSTTSSPSINLSAATPPVVPPAASTTAAVQLTAGPEDGVYFNLNPSANETFSASTSNSTKLSARSTTSSSSLEPAVKTSVTPPIFYQPTFLSICLVNAISNNSLYNVDKKDIDKFVETNNAKNSKELIKNFGDRFNIPILVYDENNKKIDTYTKGGSPQIILKYHGNNEFSLIPTNATEKELALYLSNSLKSSSTTAAVQRTTPLSARPNDDVYFTASSTKKDPVNASIPASTNPSASQPSVTLSANDASINTSVAPPEIFDRRGPCSTGLINAVTYNSNIDEDDAAKIKAFIMTTSLEKGPTELIKAVVEKFSINIRIFDEKGQPTDFVPEDGLYNSPQLILQYHGDYDYSLPSPQTPKSVSPSPQTNTKPTATTTSSNPTTNPSVSTTKASTPAASQSSIQASKLSVTPPLPLTRRAPGAEVGITKNGNCALYAIALAIKSSADQNVKSKLNSDSWDQVPDDAADVRQFRGDGDFPDRDKLTNAAKELRANAHWHLLQHTYAFTKAKEAGPQAYQEWYARNKELHDSLTSSIFDDKVKNPNPYNTIEIREISAEIKKNSALINDLQIKIEMSQFPDKASYDSYRDLISKRRDLKIAQSSIMSQIDSKNLSDESKIVLRSIHSNINNEFERCDGLIKEIELKKPNKDLVEEQNELRQKNTILEDQKLFKEIPIYLDITARDYAYCSGAQIAALSQYYDLPIEVIQETGDPRTFNAKDGKTPVTIKHQQEHFTFIIGGKKQPLPPDVKTATPSRPQDPVSTTTAASIPLSPTKESIEKQVKEMNEGIKKLVDEKDLLTNLAKGSLISADDKEKLIARIGQINSQIIAEYGSLKEKMYEKNPFIEGNEYLIEKLNEEIKNIGAQRLKFNIHIDTLRREIKGP